MSEVNTHPAVNVIYAHLIPTHSSIISSPITWSGVPGWGRSMWVEINAMCARRRARSFVWLRRRSQMSGASRLEEGGLLGSEDERPIFLSLVNVESSHGTSEPQESSQPDSHHSSDDYQHQLHVQVFCFCLAPMWIYPRGSLKPFVRAWGKDHRFEPTNRPPTNTRANTCAFNYLTCLWVWLCSPQPHSFLFNFVPLD